MLVWITGCQLKTDHMPFGTQLDRPTMLFQADSTAMFYCPLTGDSVRWRKLIFSPSCYETPDASFVFFSAKESHSASEGIGRIGLAIREKGADFNILSEPLIYPDATTSDQFRDGSGCYEPRIIKSNNGEFIMTYNTLHDGQAHIALAKSEDLLHWTKLGNINKNGSRSSAAILQEEKWSGNTAKSVDGFYFMLWGDKVVRLMQSKDLINWTPVLTPSGAERILFGPRTTSFDNEWVSPVTASYHPSGIKVLYNGGSKSDHVLGVGQVMLSPDPYFDVISRSIEAQKIAKNAANKDSCHYSIQGSISTPAGQSSRLLSSDQGGVLYAVENNY